MKSTTIPKNNILIFLLIAEAIAVTIPVIILGKYFNFPEILRLPAQNAFTLFRENEQAIVTGYYIFLLSAFLYIPLSYQLTQFLSSTNSKNNSMLVGLGITTAIFQSIGFIRWIFVMPYLTETYFSNTAAQLLVTVQYEMLNRYAGMSIGEHLGFISMGCWTLVLATQIIKEPNTRKWIGYTGIVIGLSIIVSTAEQFKTAFGEFFGLLNFVANTVWVVWLVVIIRLKKY